MEETTTNIPLNKKSTSNTYFSTRVVGGVGEEQGVWLTLGLRTVE